MTKEGEEYLALAAAIEVQGILQPILVNEQTEVLEGGVEVTVYQLIDGLQRTTIARDLKMTEIAASIKHNVSEGDQMLLQVVTNTHRVKTLPGEFSRHLARYVKANPLKSQPELAKALSISETKLRDFLKINKLPDDYIVLVDAGTLKLGNAIQLASLPEGERDAFKDQAIKDDPKTFAEKVKSRNAELKKANEGGSDAPAVFEARALLRKKDEILSFRDNKQAISDLITAEGAKSPLDGVKAALDWIFKLDSAGMKEQVSKFDDMVKQREERQKLAAARAVEKRTEQAKKKQAEATAALEASAQAKKAAEALNA